MLESVRRVARSLRGRLLRSLGGSLARYLRIGGVVLYMLSNSILKAAVKSLMSCALKMEAPGLFEMPVTVQQSTRHHIPEDLSSVSSSI